MNFFDYEIDVSFPNSKLISQEFPKVEFERNGVEYSIVDIRYFNTYITEVIITTLEAVIENGYNKVYFDASDLKEDEIDIVITALISLFYKAKKKNSFSVESKFLFLDAFITEEEDGKKILTFNLIQQHVDAIHKALKDSENKEYHIADFYEIIFNEEEKIDLSELVNKYRRRKNNDRRGKTF